MTKAPELPLLDEILGEWRSLVDGDYQGYRNHAHRMIQFCLALNPCDENEKQKIICGLAKSEVNEIRSSLPTAGFHWMLVKRAIRWFVKHPLDPAPMFKW